MSGISANTLLLIQALKALGRENITKETIRLLRKRFSPEERTVILEESRRTINWIHSAIKEICKP